MVMNDSSRDMGRGSGAIIGFVIGAAVGAGIALLYAPDSGVETRRRLGRTATRLRSSLDDGVSVAKERIGDLTSEVKGRLGGLKEDVKTAVDTGRETFHRDREARRTES
jgi:gas vesicle protein